MKDNILITEVLNNAQHCLLKAGFDSARTDAELLLSFVLDCSRSGLYLGNGQINIEQDQLFKDLLRLRLEGQPVQYLTGKAYFFGLELCVGPEVLIPRPETEILVQTILDKVRPSLCRPHRDRDKACILDIGTGSGNISIALTKNEVSCKIVASDISEEAISVALKNARMHKVDDRIEFVCLDLNDPGLKLEREQLKLIVSNPPYIQSKDIALLDKEVLAEPRTALDGGSDGLCFYSLIIDQVKSYLKKGGYLALEIGEDQATAVTEIIRRTGKFEEIEVIRDLNQKDRVILAQRSS